MRIVTRPDFDGIVCAVLLTDTLGNDIPVKWTEPNAMQSGKAEILEGDIIANLAYKEKCSLWFDHHLSNKIDIPFEGVFKLTPSAARIIFEYYQGTYKRDHTDLVKAADKIDSADLTLDEVLHPEKYPYISLDMTISGRRKEDGNYWDRLVTLLRESEIREVLADPAVKERIKIAAADNKEYFDFLKKYTRLDGYISITDFRTLKKPPRGNRFLVFSIFPESAVNVKIRYERDSDEQVVVSLGHSIFNKACKTNVGEICAGFGGGGHWGAGSCCFPAEQAEINIGIILDALHKDMDCAPAT